MERNTLKMAIGALFDALSEEHPLRHQNAYASRYLMKARSGLSIEIMFEKSERSPANIWVTESVARSLSTTRIKQRLSPGASLWTKVGSGGTPNYGRHSALEKMPQLGEADLVCLAPENLEQAGAIIDTLTGL